MTKEKNLSDEKETSTMDSSKNTTSYVPIGFIGLNSFSNEHDPHSYSLNNPSYSMPIPQPMNVPSGSNANMSLHKTHDPPYPHSMKVNKIPPFSPQNSNGSNVVGFISAESPKPTINNKTASAPTVEEIDNKTGLTGAEREELIEAFFRMKNNVYEKVGSPNSDFKAAKTKVIAILSAASSRLTDFEYEEFLVKWKEINNTRSNFIKMEEKDEQIIQEREKERKQKKLREVEAVIMLIMKFFQFILIYLIFFTYSHDFEINSIVLNTLAIIFTILSVFLHCCQEYFSLLFYAHECLFSVFFGFYYLVVADNANQYKVLGYSLVVLYCIELCLTTRILIMRDFSLDCFTSNISSSILNNYRPEISTRRSNTSRVYSSRHNRFYLHDHSTNDYIVESGHLPTVITNSHNFNSINHIDSCLYSSNDQPTDSDANYHQDAENECTVELIEKDEDNESCGSANNENGSNHTTSSNSDEKEDYGCENSSGSSQDCEDNYAVSDSGGGDWDNGGDDNDY